MKTVNLKRYLCIFLSIVSVVMLTLCVGCGEANRNENKTDGENNGNAGEVENIVLPPTRVGKSDMSPLLAKGYTFQTAMEDAEVVARIQIGNWLGEDTEKISTYFEAKVLQCFKGTIPENFTLLQDGCSDCTMMKPSYPLFTYGNELLVFLKEAEGLDNYSSPYWIIGSFSTFLDVSYDDNDIRYYVDRYGILGETMNISNNYAHESNVRAEVYNIAATADSMVSEQNYDYSYIFSESDLVALMGS